MPIKSSYCWCLLSLIILFGPFLYASKTTATSNGNWNNSGTWDNGVPGCGDTIIIDSGVTVDVNVQVFLDEASSCSTAMYLEVKGTLDFDGGKKMYLPCNSHVFVAAGGTVSGGGGGSSNLIQICGVTVWQTSDSTVTGPVPIGPGLPIALIKFNAEVEFDRVKLSWTTASEINNDFFTVESSRDLKSFEEVLQYPGAGNSREIIDYEAYDNYPIQGVSYYRLKQTDYDGSISISDPVAIEYNKLRNKDWIVYPSLVTGNFIIMELDDTESSHILVELFSIEGIRLFGEKLSLAKDQSVYIMDISSIDYRGMVVIRLSSHFHIYVSQLVLASD